MDSGIAIKVQRHECVLHCPQSNQNRTSDLLGENARSLQVAADLVEEIAYNLAGYVNSSCSASLVLISHELRQKSRKLSLTELEVKP